MSQPPNKSADTKSVIFTDEWCKAISVYLKKVKKLHAVSYKDISERLKAYKINISPENVSVRISSGKISSNLLLAVLVVLGEDQMDVAEILKIYKRYERKAQKAQGK